MSEGTCLDCGQPKATKLEQVDDASGFCWRNSRACRDTLPWRNKVADLSSKLSAATARASELETIVDCAAPVAMWLGRIGSENDAAMDDLEAYQEAVSKKLTASVTTQESKTMANPITRYFAFDHLPEGPLKVTSAMVFELACQIEATVPDGPEKSAGLRKLLEAKDCFVRAVIP